MGIHVTMKVEPLFAHKGVKKLPIKSRPFVIRNYFFILSSRKRETEKVAKGKYLGRASIKVIVG